MAYRVLIDLNVLVDALTGREPFSRAAARVLAAAEAGQIEGLIAAHSITTLFYLVAKDTSPAAARIHLIRLVQMVRIAAVNEQIVQEALALPYPDFEDAVQMMAGVHAGAQYVVTWDRAGFKTGPLPILSPAELLALIARSN